MQDLSHDSESVAAVYHRLSALLRNVATSRFHVPPGDAEALVHDVFATYLTQRTKVRQLRPYLIGGICFASRDYWRKRKNEERLVTPIEEDDTLPHDDADESAGPAATPSFLEHLDRQMTVGAVLARIGSRCRETLRRYYLHGESAAEIAEATETTATYVCSLLSKCRKRARVVYAAISHRGRS